MWKFDFSSNAEWVVGVLLATSVRRRHARVRRRHGYLPSGGHARREDRGGGAVR